MSISLVDSWEILVTYSTVFLFVFDMDQTPESTKLNQLRRVLELSNRTTPAEKNSDVEWKTPSKGGYPENAPRSHAMKWSKSEETLLTFFWKKESWCAQGKNTIWITITDRKHENWIQENELSNHKRNIIPWHISQKMKDKRYNLNSARTSAFVCKAFFRV